MGDDAHQQGPHSAQLLLPHPLIYLHTCERGEQAFQGHAQNWRFHPAKKQMIISQHVEKKRDVHILVSCSNEIISKCTGRYVGAQKPRVDFIWPRISSALPYLFQKPMCVVREEFERSAQATLAILFGPRNFLEVDIKDSQDCCLKVEVVLKIPSGSSSYFKSPKSSKFGNTGKQP